MTDDDKALVERLRGDWPEILVEKHWMMDSDAIDKQREEAASRIEAQAAEIEKLREEVQQVVTGRFIAAENAIEAAAAEERAKIVEYLRKTFGFDSEAADAIEAKEHLE